MSIKGYIPCSLVDWPGLLPAVIFIGGCNLKGWYCHNAELAQHPEKFPDLDLAEILHGANRPKVGWQDGFVITGGEPTLVPPLLGRYINIIRREKLKIKVDTNGTLPSVLEKILPFVDLVAMDIKAPLNQADYESVTGPVEINNIKRSIELLKHSGKVMFRTTAAPGIDIERIQKELDAPLVVQPWRPQDDGR